MERRLVFAILLSMGILYLWNVVINPPPPPEETPQPVVEQPKQPEAPAELPTFDDPDETGDAPKMLPPKDETPVDAEKVPAEDGIEGVEKANTPEEVKELEPEAPVITENPEREIIIETDQYRAVFTSRGARLKSFVLKEEKYTRPVHGSKEREQVDIVSTEQPKNLPYTLLLDQANFKYDPETVFAVEKSDNRSVTFRADTPQGVVVRKRFTWEKGYVFALDVEIENDAAAAVSFFPKIRMVGYEDTVNLQEGIFGSMPLNQQIPKAFIDGEIWEETDKDELAASVIKKGVIQWTALDDRYFLLSLLPPQDERSQILVKNVVQPYNDAEGEGKRSWLAITHSLEKQSVPVGDKKVINYRLFIGPKEYTRLGKVGNQLEESVDFWVLGVLAKPMLWILQYSQNVVVNWGVAIIILTILIKILLYPLTQKSFQSMQKMKDLKPKIDALKEKLGDDKQEFNKQMMELYKKEGVNPMGGCLPMLLQMPVYIALYKMLQNSVELYNSPFIPGWINDLVQPDPYYIMPVLLSGLMFLQQKLTPTPDSQQQKMMMYMMPAMMFIFMIMLPSGLVLYILANTVMTIIQQWMINKKAQEQKAASKA